jgi:CHAD domain-containing protein
MESPSPFEGGAMPSSTSEYENVIKDLKAIRDKLGRIHLIRKSVINEAIQSLSGDQPKPRIAREQLSSIVDHVPGIRKVMASLR